MLFFGLFCASQRVQRLRAELILAVAAGPVSKNFVVAITTRPTGTKIDTRFQEKPSRCRNEQVCQGRKSVKRFERSNGLITALGVSTIVHKSILLPVFICTA